MPTEYDIAPHAEGWAVLENGRVIEVRPDREDAEAVAQLLDSVSRALTPRARSAEPSTV